MMPTKMECFKLALCFLFFWLKPLSANKPNIIIILADDLGWNDVGFHGSDEIPTPNIDALAYNGIVLNRHYVLPTCTPSRAALMTGKYPIRTGLQGDPGRSQQASGLPLKEKILPQYLKEQGYKTHLIGKWHLGFYQTAYTPTKRGFDSHFGYYNGWIRYNDSVVSSYPFVGKDARRNLQPAGDEFVGKYATDVFTDEAVKIIKRHDQTSPLFLEISQPAVHAVREDILQVRNEEQNEKDFAYIEDKQRRLLAGVIQPLDETVARVVEALHETGMLNNSVILFMSDNGGATEDPYWRFRNVASNWPLRGMKTSLHEGGVRGVAAIWSPLFKNKGYVSNDLFHMSDWLPTFVAAAGGNLTDLKDIDGVNQWELLVGNKNHSERQVVLVNINTLRNNSALIFMKWKLISNNETFRPTFADKYAGASGRNLSRSYDIAGVLASTTNKLISTISGKVPEDMKDLFLSVRSNATIDSNCKLRIANILSSTDAERCRRKCLYNLETDPCEVENIIDSFPDVVSDLENKLKKFESESLPIDRGKNDYRADPKNWGGYWSPWLDHEARSNTSSTIIREVLIIGITFIVCRKIVRVLTIVM